MAWRRQPELGIQRQGVLEGWGTDRGSSRATAWASRGRRVEAGNTVWKVSWERQKGPG